MTIHNAWRLFKVMFWTGAVGPFILALLLLSLAMCSCAARPVDGGVLHCSTPMTRDIYTISYYHQRSGKTLRTDTIQYCTVKP